MRSPRGGVHRAVATYVVLLFSALIPGIVSQSLPQLLSMPCPNLCSGHGWCDSGDRRCQCYAGYRGADCSSPASGSCDLTRVHLNSPQARCENVHRGQHGQMSLMLSPSQMWHTRWSSVPGEASARHLLVTVSAPRAGKARHVNEKAVQMSAHSMGSAFLWNTLQQLVSQAWV